MAQTIKLGKRNVKVYHFTGKVVGASKNLETKISGGGGGGGGGFSYKGTGSTAPTYTNPIESTTYVHDQLFLKDREGNERALQLVDFDIACRKGHIVTAMWAIPEGKKTGSYFTIINHSTNSKFTQRSVIENIAKRYVHPLPIRNELIYTICILGIIMMLQSKTLVDIAWQTIFILLFVMVGILLYSRLGLWPEVTNRFFKSVNYPDAERW